MASASRVTTEKPGDPKAFYSLADFYQFIKIPSNNPQMHIHNVVQLYPALELDDKNNVVLNSMYNRLFSPDNCRRFSLSAQKVDIPNISLSVGPNVNTPIGNWSTIENSTLGVQSDSLNINFLEMKVPIIEQMIYPWLMRSITN